MKRIVVFGDLCSESHISGSRDKELFEAVVRGGNRTITDEEARRFRELNTVPRFNLAQWLRNLCQRNRKAHD